MSKIEWTDETWNPVVGCSVTSPGCTNCYAMRMAARLEAMGRKVDFDDNGYATGWVNPLRHYCGTTQKSKAGPVWTGHVDLASEHILTKPLRWKKPRRVFVNSMGDLFHENVPDEWIDRVFAVMALCTQHTFQVLTKRSKRMRDYCCSLGRHHTEDRLSITLKQWDASGFLNNGGFFYKGGNGGFHLENVWLGVTAEDQTRADERIPDLLATPAAVRFVSCEPLLGPIDLRAIWSWCPEHDFASGFCVQRRHPGVRWIDLVIAGGETSPNARPMHPDWARKLRDDCVAAGVPYFFKQHGEWIEVPWKLIRFEGESDDSYKARSEEGAATHAVSPWGQLNKLGHAPWSMERASIGAPHAGIRRVGKKHAGRLLDGVEHNGMPEVAARLADDLSKVLKIE